MLKLMKAVSVVLFFSFMTSANSVEMSLVRTGPHHRDDCHDIYDRHRCERNHHCEWRGGHHHGYCTENNGGGHRRCRDLDRHECYDSRDCYWDRHEHRCRRDRH